MLSTLAITGADGRQDFFLTRIRPAPAGLSSMPSSEYFRSMNLKAKVAVAVAAIVALIFLSALYLTFSYFGKTFKESIAVQQHSLVATLAENTEAKLRIAQTALVNVSAAIPPPAWTDPEAAQRFLDARLGLRSIFDNNLLLISPDGKIVAEQRYLPGRRGMDLSFREWFRRTVELRRSYISEPFVSTHLPNHPAVMITAPVFAADGTMLGLFVGSFDLLSENFLAEIGKVRIGQEGYLYITDSHGIMIAHPDKRRIMHGRVDHGANLLFDRALKGFEGTGETVNSSGVRVLTTFKRMRLTSWILAANYPVSEAYASLDQARRYLVGTAVAAVLVLLLITWLIMKRLMEPLVTFTRHVQELPSKCGDDRHIAIATGDEIGVLATAFNSMIDTLDRQKEELAGNQRELEALNRSLEERIMATVNDLRQKDQALIQQSRLAVMGEMINNIAHQWRQPLNNLGLLVQYVGEEAKGGTLSQEEAREQAASMMHIIDYMSRTIDDFRNFFCQDKLKRSFNVGEVVTDTLEIIGASLKSAGIEVELEVDDCVTVEGFRNEYAQVLLNVLGNARDVLVERKVPQPKIRIALRCDDGRSVVTVADNAGGVDEDVLPRIYDLYFSTKEGGKGSGIGLYMSKVIIEKNMGGALYARNVGSGAEFTIVV